MQAERTFSFISILAETLFSVRSWHEGQETNAPFLKFQPVEIFCLI